MGKFDQTQTNKPLPGQYEQLKKFWEGAGQLYDTGGLEYYPGQMNPDRDPFSYAAKQAVGDLGSSQYMDAAEAYLGDVLGGGYLAGPNKALDDRFKVMSDRISEAYKRTTAPTTASRFAAAGRVGSPAYGKAIDQNERNLGEALGRTAADVYYADYNAERSRMDDAVRTLPAFRGLQYGDIAQMREQGGIEEGYQMRDITDLVNRFNFAQMEREQKLDRFGSRVANNLGFGVQTTTMPGAGFQMAMQAMGGLGGLIGGVGGLAEGFGWGK